MKTRFRLCQCAGAAFAGASFLVLATSHRACAHVLVPQYSLAIPSSGGLGGAGFPWADMVFDRYTTSQDGWGWAGGAGGVQGSQSTTNSGGYAVPANQVFKFDIGSSVDAWNSAYGAGNWTISNLKLTFASSYAKQNNSRFGTGSGTFDIYWTQNDLWEQAAGTPDDRKLNPVYATTKAELDSWAGSSDLLGSEEFTVPAGGTGYVNLTYNLSIGELLLDDVLNASASSSPYLSLYLMGTSDTLGMIIFTGGQSQPRPTITFDVVSVPEPGTIALLAVAASCGFYLRARRKS